MPEKKLHTYYPWEFIISRLEEGLIREEWELLDQLTLLQQLDPAGSTGGA